MKLKLMKSQKGQTAVEYLLMISLAVSLGVTLFARLDDYLIKNPNGLIAKPLKRISSLLNTDSKGRYQRFPLRLPK